MPPIAGSTPNTMLYLDNRMKPDMFATEAEMAARERHLRGGGPLRLINSGRLEPMKGSQDLIPVAVALRARGVAFTLDIYGAGSLEDRIRQEIDARNLGDLVTLHAPVDFETELVPLSRTSADLFLSCHHQSDPSCTYLEAMGCGLALVGYDNQMLAGLSAGIQQRLVSSKKRCPGLGGSHRNMCGQSRCALIGDRARGGFCQGPRVLSEFTRRNDHMISIAGASAPSAPIKSGGDVRTGWPRMSPSGP